MRRSKKKSLIVILLTLAVSMLMGCGQVSNTREDIVEESASGEAVSEGALVPFAEYTQVPITLAFFSEYAWQEDKFIYLEQEFIKELNATQGTLWSAAVDGTGVAEELLQNVPGERAVELFAVDKEQNLYLWERFRTTDMKNQYSLRKLDKNMETIYDVMLEEKGFQSNTFWALELQVTDQGQLVMIDTNSYVYLFDKTGKLISKEFSELRQGTLISAGEQGLFLWQQNPDALGISNVMIQKIDFDNGKLGEVKYYDFSALAGGTGGSGGITLLSGFDKGILISSYSTLWQYDLDTNEETELMSWQGNGIAIDGATVAQIHFSDGEWKILSNGQKLPEMQALIHNQRSGEVELARISFVDKDEIPAKQKITLGTFYSYAIEDLVNSFNKESKDYYIEIKKYENVYAMANLFITGEDEMPDLLDIRGIDIGMLESKGLLEDLMPYFSESDVVKKEDILDAVWNACENDGKLTSIMSGFSIQTLTTTVEDIPTGGWTVEQFLGLEQQYPESRPIDTYTQWSVWNLLSATGLGQYVNWNEKKCYFDSPEFKAFLEGLGGLHFQEVDTGQRVYNTDEMIAQFLAGEYLLYQNYYSSPYEYQKYIHKYGDEIKNVGFPTPDGTPYYILQPKMQIAMYSDSEQKEGAWTFIEYMLSEEEQSWYGQEVSAFPVRKSALDVYLTKPYSRIDKMIDEISSEKVEEVKELAAEIKKMFPYLHLSQRSSSTIADIVIEEVQAYFAGDKTVEETAAIIQNRAQLYIDENF